MPSPRASSSYSREKESGGGPTRPASRRARMCSTTSRCSITRSVATATTTGYRRSSSSGDTSTRSRVSKKVGSIQRYLNNQVLVSVMDEFIGRQWFGGLRLIGGFATNVLEQSIAPAFDERQQDRLEIS